MNNNVLEMIDVQKSYGSTTAIEQANFKLKKGTVVALVGANGAGKSTLMNILGGVIKANKGKIIVNGSEVYFNSPSDAAQMGIQFVHQELSVFKTMTVAENIFIHQFPSRYSLIKKGEIVRVSRQLLRALGSELDPETSVESLSTGDCQMVVIARAMLGNPEILILDEPTSSLSQYEKQKLHEVIKRLKYKGVSIIYITHFISEIFDICDYVTIMRNGSTIISTSIKETDNKQIIETMLGNVVAYGKNTKRNLKDQIFLSVKDLNKNKKVENASFKLKKGEILGIWGLLGSGRTELVRSLIGLDGKPKGSIKIEENGRLVPISSEKLAHITAFVSEDRRGEGVLLAMSVSRNTALPNLDKISNFFGWVQLKKFHGLAARVIKSLFIKVSSPEQLVGTLSGGNQQKIVFGKWLETNPNLLILDEPTRGLDISAKEEILRLAINLANSGVSILFITSELEELMTISDRYIILSERCVIGSLPGNSSKEDLIKALSDRSLGDPA